MVFINIIPIIIADITRIIHWGRTPMKPVVPRFLYAQHAWYLLMLVFCSPNMQTTCWFPFSMNLISPPRSKSHAITYSNDHYDYFRSAVFHVAPHAFLFSSPSPPPPLYHQLHYPRGLVRVILHISIHLVHLIPLVFFTFLVRWLQWPVIPFLLIIIELSYLSYITGDITRRFPLLSLVQNSDHLFFS